jgi:hypothetical protein
MRLIAAGDHLEANPLYKRSGPFVVALCLVYTTLQLSFGYASSVRRAVILCGRRYGCGCEMIGQMDRPQRFAFSSRPFKKHWMDLCWNVAHLHNTCIDVRSVVRFDRLLKWSTTYPHRELCEIGAHSLA